MKVLFVTSSLSGGGAERVLSVLANAFSENSEISSVSVVAVIEDKISYNLNKNISYYAYKPEKISKLKQKWRRYLFLKKHIKKEEPDLIISFATQINLYSLLANLNMSSKIIISERNDPYRDPTQWIVRKLRDITYLFCDGAVFQTLDAQDYFKFLINKKQEVILNPLKEGLPAPIAGERDKKIVTVARLHPAKNLAMLIKVFARIVKEYPEFHLEIYGEGDERKKLEQLSQKLFISNKVHFLGYMTSVHEHIKSATCFVLPSNYEGVSNAMIESMAIGVPTICTDCPIGGAKMIINHMENGILTPVDDEDMLFYNIKLLIDNEQIQMRFTERSSDIRKHLSSKKIAQQWIDFSKKVIR